MLPHKLAVDAQENLYIIDREGHRLQVFDKNLNYLREIKVEGWNPWDIGISRKGDDGFAYIADHALERVHKLSLKDGKLVATWGKQGLGPGEFDWVHGIVVDSKGAVYAADTYGQRMQKFVPSGVDVEPVVSRRSATWPTVNGTSERRSSRSRSPQSQRGWYHHPLAIPALFHERRHREHDAAITVNCPPSTPRLNVSSPVRNSSRGRPSSRSTPANPRPCSKPNMNTSASRHGFNSRVTRFSIATYAIDSAISGSTMREGRETMP